MLKAPAAAGASRKKINNEMIKQGVHDKFFALLAQLPGATKEDIVWEYSNTITTSLKEFYKLSPEEYTRMIADLQVKVNKLNNKYWVSQEVKRLRSSVLHRLQKHGVNTADWKCVNTFLAQPRIAGKMLFEMDIEELTALIPKLEQILKKDAFKRDAEIKLTELN
jgi:hypothetical protein